MFPALAKLLKEHRLASPFSQDEDFVFASEVGTPMLHRNVVRRGLDKAIERAKLNGRGKPDLRWHDLRHTYASVLIAQGRDVVYVSRQLGHANATITLKIYGHLFDAAAAREAGAGGARGAVREHAQVKSHVGTR